VQLVDDLRHQVMRLEVEPASSRSEIERRIEADLRLYAPLATAPSEATELVRLRGQLAHVLQLPSDAPDRAARFDQVHTSLARLVEINTAQANLTTAEIDRVHRSALLVRLISVLLTIAAASVVATVLLRVLRRQRALVQADIEQLSERNKDLTEFVGRTAHDLRGPLTPIRGYADLLAAGSADVAKAAARIRTSAERMSDILEDLVMLSTSGTLPPGEVDVAPLTREVLSDLATELAGAHTKTVLEDCRAAVAPSVLRQILHNLVSNACKYRDPTRELELEIAGRCRPDHIEIVISDNGLGMSPEVAAHVFEPYYRAPRTREIPGFGLGLSIVKRMLQAVGGTCQLDSELGRGTRFVLHVPRTVAQSPATHDDDGRA
jgi:two-component system, OmpR family, sensor kinase